MTSPFADATRNGGPASGAIDRFVPASLHQGAPDQRRRARMLVVACAIATVALAWVSGMQLLGRLWGTATLAASAALVFAMLPFVLRATASITAVAHLYAAVVFALTLAFTVLRGGHAPASTGALALVPLITALLGGRRIGAVWMVLTVGALTTLATIAYFEIPFPTVFAPDSRAVSPFRGAITLALVASALGFAFDWLKDRALDEMKSAQRDRTESDTRLRLMAENASDAISEWSEAGQAIYLSPQARLQIGAPPQGDLDGQAVLKRVHPEDIAALTGAVGEATRRGEGVKASFRALDAQDEWRWLEVSFDPFRTAEGQRHLVAVARDVSDRREVEMLRRLTAELEMTTNELQRANQELAEFTSIASHDLQEPVRRLVSFSELLRDDLGEDLPEVAATDLAMIGDGARRMQELVQDLLALSRAGSAPMARSRVAVKECVERALEALSLQIDESAAIITRDELPELDADVTLMAAVYQNLISNALKFVTDAPPRIHLSADPDPAHPGAWILGVRDRGIGVPADQVEELFKPFRRLHTRDRFPGSGIGLAICRKAVERHGGRIWVERPQDGGSHFRFRIPAADDRRETLAATAPDPR